MRESPASSMPAPYPRSGSTDRVGLLAGAGSLVVHGALAAVLVLAKDISSFPEPDPPVAYQVVYMAPPAPSPAQLFAAALADAIEIPEEPTPPVPAETEIVGPSASAVSAPKAPDRPPRTELAAFTPPDAEAIAGPATPPPVFAPRPGRKPELPTRPAPRREPEPVTAPAKPPSTDPTQTTLSALIANATGQRCPITVAPPPFAPPRALGHQPIPAEIIEDTLARYAGPDAIAPNGWLEWWQANRDRFAEARFDELMAETNARAGAFDAGAWAAFEAGAMDAGVIARLMRRHNGRATAAAALGPESAWEWWREMARYEYRRWQAWAYQVQRARAMARLLALDGRAGTSSSMAGCAEVAQAGGPG